MFSGLASLHQRLRWARELIAALRTNWPLFTDDECLPISSDHIAEEAERSSPSGSGDLRTERGAWPSTCVCFGVFKSAAFYRQDSS